MEVIELVQDMRRICEELRNRQDRLISFVPTMGALHDGHARLIELARQPASLLQTEKSTCRAKETSCVIVSIFVNPKQFNDPADFEKYPSTLGTDLEICKRLSVDYVFTPNATQMYPDGLDGVAVRAPNRIANDLEGSSRPGHFEGMLTVVCKLFSIIRPHKAYFGEKDYQQLVLVERMVRDLNLDIQICPVPIVRDSDSLPLSSRNVRLGPAQRRLATFMPLILSHVSILLKSNDSQREQPTDDFLLDMGRRIEVEGNLKIDYLALRCAKDFSKILFRPKEQLYDCQFGCFGKYSNTKSQNNLGTGLKTRLLISVLVDDVRLLDNVSIQLNE